MKLYVKKAKNKDGIKETLWVDFMHDGKRYRKPLKLDNTPANRKMAEKKLIPALHYQIISGEFFKNTDKKIPTVDEYMRVSFKLQSGSRSEAVQYDYEKKYLKHLAPIFGNTLIDQVETNDITKWQNHLLKVKKLKPKTIKQIRGILNTMFEDALKEKDAAIVKNPVVGVGKLKEEIKISEDNINDIIDEAIKPFSIDEIALILDNAVDIQMRNLFALLFMTGCRGGEAISLTWEKVNFRKKEILINRKVRQGVFGLPKYRSIRKIPILDALMPYLKNQYKLTGDKDSFVFLNNRDKHFWDISKVRESYWKNTLKNARVNYRTPHQARHTFISTLISNGDDINYVSKLAGHDSVKTTLEVYSHFIPNNNATFGSIFNKKLGTK